MLDRFAVISDVHGNVDALRAVLDDIANKGITQILNLGDHFSGPLAAGETADLVCGHDMLCIRGNHDRWLAETPPELHSGSEAAAWPQLSKRHLEWLKALPARRAVGDVMMCHGTPESDTEYLLERVTSGALVLDEPEAIASRAGPADFSLILCGHSHIARRVDLPDGRVVLNPGSVGCPAYRTEKPDPHRVQSGSPAASYAFAERTDAGWHSSIRSVSYDTSRMVLMAKRSSRPRWSPMLATGWLDQRSQ